MFLPFEGPAAMLFRIFQWIFSKVLSVVYRRDPKMTPTVKNSLLLESATSLASKIRNRKVTSVEVVKSYIERIREINDILNCVVDERFESALSEAAKADDIIQSGKKTVEEIQNETPLLGVPFSCPDAVAASRTSGRSTDDDVVALMKSSGAILIACTNVSESPLLRETNNRSHGRTNNPYNSNCSVGGPFGGEASLIAACGSPVGVAPSVTISCAFNGVFGHQNHFCGVLSRNSSDLLPLLTILKQRANPNLNLDAAVDLKNLKYYYMFGDGATAIDPEIETGIQKTVNHFQNVHKARVEKVDIKQLQRSNFIWKCKTQSNKDGGLNLYKELIKVFCGKSEHTLIHLLTLLSDRYIYSYSNVDRETIKKENSELLKRFQDLLGTNGVFIYPSHPTAALLHDDSAARDSAYGHSAVFEALGLPVSHCPLGLHPGGLPVGLQVVAAVGEDRLSVAVAREVDKVFGGWKPPPSHGTFTLKSTMLHTLNNEKVKTM